LKSFSALFILWCAALQGTGDPVETIATALRERNIPAAMAAVSTMKTPLTEQERNRLVEAMKQLSPQGDWVPFLQKLAEKNDSDGEFLFFTAQASWRAGDIDAAIDLSGRAMGAAQDDTALMYKCAAIARTSGHNEEAKRRIEKILALDSRHLDALFLLGSIQSEEGHTDLARKTLSRVIDCQPDHFRALYELGKLETRAGDSEAAVQHLQAAVHAYPFFREAYSALRVPLARTQKQEELKKVQRILLHTRRWDPDTYARLRHSFQNAYTISPEESAELAAELVAVEREDLSKAYLENLHKQGKTNENLKILLAQLRFNAKEHTECMWLLESIQDCPADETDTYIALKAWTLFMLGRVDESRAIYAKFESQFKNSPHFQALGSALAKLPQRQQRQVDTEVPRSATASIRFVDRTAEAGLSQFRHILGHKDKRWIIDAMGSGVAVADYDNDGDDDIYFVNGRPNVDKLDPAWRNALFRNDGGVFTDVTEQSGVGDLGWGMCAVFGDVNNDGWLDLFVGNYGPNVFYRNDGDGTFSEVTKQAGLEHDGYAAAAAFADVDHDGDLDLFVGNYVSFDPKKHGHLRENYHGVKVMMGPMAFEYQPDLLYFNDGTGRFVESSAQAAINISEGRAMGAAFVDFENNGNLDLYVANDSTYNHVLRNDGRGHFTDISFLSGAAVCESGRDGASMGVAVGDYNNDTLFDILVTSYEQESDVLFQNDGEGYFTDMTGPLGLLGPSRWLVTWGSGFCDFDADGLLDFYTVNGNVYPQVDELPFGRTYHQGVSFYRNIGRRFEDVSSGATSAEVKRTAGRGSALLDYDSDGDMDIVINCIDDSPRLLENRSERGHWLQARLEGTSAQTFGVRVVARKGERRWARMVDGGSGYLSQNSQVLHFGFGEVDRIDDLTIYWFHSQPQVIVSPCLNQRLTIKAPE